MNYAVKRPETKAEPTQARAQARRKSILDAAYSFALEGNVENITTTSIARRAGIPVGSIYRYFDDRTHIIDQLYKAAYADVENNLIKAQENISTDWSIGKIIHYLLECFWQQARMHPTFRTLTRWANKHYSVWDVTPGTNGNLANMIEQALNLANVTINESRQAPATKTLVTTASILVDMAIEEDNEDCAAALINELAILLEAYVNTFSSNT